MYKAKHDLILESKYLIWSLILESKNVEKRREGEKRKREEEEEEEEKKEKKKEGRIKKSKGMELVWFWVWKARILYGSLVLYGSYDFGMDFSMEVWILYGFFWVFMD